MARPAGTFDLGRVLGRAAGALRRHPAPFLLAALLLAVAPRMAGQLLLAQLQLDIRRSAWFSLAWLAAIILTSTALKGAVIQGVAAAAEGRSPRLAEMARRGVAVSGSLGLAAILAWVAMGVGLVLLIVPGLIVAAMLGVAAPARTLEGGGVIGALTRSLELTKGRRGLILLMLLGFWTVVILVRVLMGLGVEAITGAANLPPASQVTALLAPGASVPHWAWAWRAVFDPLLGAAQDLIASAGLASIYIELREAREGLRADELAAAFA